MTDSSYRHATKVYIISEWDDDEPVAVAFTEEERDRLLDLGDDRSWRESYCYENVVVAK